MSHPHPTRPGAGTACRLQRIEALEARVLLADVPPGFNDAQIATNLSSPTAMAVAPDGSGRVFVAEQSGDVRVVKNGQLLALPFASVETNNVGERGLVGIAFDPDFAANQYVYVYYAAETPAQHNRVSRFTAAGDFAVDGSEVAILDLPPIDGAVQHMGGALDFGADGRLYVAVGDHSVGSNAQSLSNPFGKILRINKDGSIPTDNPFYDQTSGVNRAIWARGLRNPFTFAFQGGTGRMFINDVGQESWEEINDGRPGANYGWPASEGPNNTGGFDAPFYYYGHAEGCSIAGAAFYDPASAQFPASYEGLYFFGDYCGGWIRTIDPNDASSVGTFATGIDAIVDVDVDADGTMFYLARGFSLSSGIVGRITYGESGATIHQQPQDQVAAIGEPVTFSVIASGTQTLDYQWQRRDAGAGGFTDIVGASTSSYTIPSVAGDDDGAAFRVVVTNPQGAVTSEEAVLTLTINRLPTAIITAPGTGATFRAGDTINYNGLGTDPEDGTLPPSAFTWQVDYYTNGLVRPFLPATGGATGGSFVIPTTGVYKRTDVLYRILLTVIDSGGRAHTTARDIHPLTSTVTLDSNFPGLTLELDGQPVTTPFTFDGVVNFQREVGAPSPQALGGVGFEFARWSDGGAGVHTISMPEEDATVTAVYRPLPYAYVSDLPFLSETNGHGPVERDQSNGEGEANDGLPITLDGVVYAKGLGVHANAEIELELNGRYARFTSDIGVDDEVHGSGSVVFRVYGDSNLLYQSPTRTGNSPTLSIDVDVTGVHVLRLEVNDAGDGAAFDHADWAGARLLARPLSVTHSGFRYETAPHALRFEFDANVHGDFGLDDLVVRNLTTQSNVPLDAMALAYDTSANAATITFPGLLRGLLPDGNYRATILAQGVISNDGNPLAEDHVFEFFFLTGDANHDGRVNLQDFNIFAANFGKTPRDFTQGDFNYDGIVNLRDFNLLATRFGGALSAGAVDRNADVLRDELDRLFGTMDV